MAVKLYACEALLLGGTHDLAVVDTPAEVGRYEAECERLAIRRRRGPESREPLKPGEYIVWEM